MNIGKLVIGIFLVLLSLAYFVYTLRSMLKDENYRPILFSFDIKILFATVAICVVGLILIYREVFE
ncbi:hypothetical protein [Flagellimonas myxillae]|uniref:hypothetical protein n=1 Tax=Flagellimonas myxillae TaxID=2942214 RepID=UPI00201F31E1|nr:hypothetical protein [Muricauda myxillae]MCL6265431.1 hypothetical protein [Muricauda myxillae]